MSPAAQPEPVDAAQIASWPAIAVTLHDDQHASIIGNGATATVHGEHADATRQAAVTHVANEFAVRLGRPVRVTCTDPDSTHWELIVTPEGHAHESPLRRRRPGRRDAPTPPQPAASDAPPALELLTSHPRPLTAASAGGRTAALADLFGTRPAKTTMRADRGWQAIVRKLSGDRLFPPLGAAEAAHRRAVGAVQSNFDGPKTIMIVNPKGGAHKTTAAYLLGATFGTLRGGYTLAWDNNETLGNLGSRAATADHARTAIDLLRDLERFNNLDTARIADLDHYVRRQAAAPFHILASDEDPASPTSIKADEYHRLHRLLIRYYRIIIVDTGNNMRAPNWRAARDTADQLVLVCPISQDTGSMADALIAAHTPSNHNSDAEKMAHAITILSSPTPTTDRALRNRLHHHFSSLTRAVLEVPYDPALRGGGPIDYHTLRPSTRQAWIHVAAAIATGLGSAS